MTTPSDYVPHILPSKSNLDKLLAEQSIINQTTLALTGEQLEILALGLTFVPAFRQKNEAEIHAQQYEQWAAKIDTAIHFAGRVDNSTNPNKGWLNKDIPSTWLPPRGSWRDDQLVRELARDHLLIDNYRDTKTTPVEIQDAIQSLANNQYVHILKADKGRNAVIWLVNDYDAEAERQLNDIVNYKELSKNDFDIELAILFGKITRQAAHLYESKFLTKKEFEAMTLNTTPSGAYIYFLAKTHKKPGPSTGTFVGRPIVATHSATIHLLDKYITRVTAPLLARIPGSLKDTFDLLERLPHKLPFGQHTAIITADVDSLYPNIPWTEGLEASVNFYRDNLQWLRKHATDNGTLPPPDLASFAYAIDLVLTNSLFTFKNRRWFRQIRGTAMGMCISVYFANAYMYHVTKTYVDNTPPRVHTFLRYIDDIIIIFDNSPSTETNPNIFDTPTGKLNDSVFFKNISNDNIGYSIEGPSLSQSFLDVSISLDTVSNSITTGPYKKPTNSNTFLHAKSNHPRHTFRAVPIAQFQRLRRISSTTHLFKTAAIDLMKNLFQCGYAKRDIWNGYNEALNQSRHKSAPNPPQQSTNSTNSIQTKKTNAKTNAKRNATSLAFKFITTHNTAAGAVHSRAALNKIHETARRHYFHLASGDDNNGHPINLERAQCLAKNNSVLINNVTQNVGSYFTKNVKNPEARTTADNSARNIIHTNLPGHLND